MTDLEAPGLSADWLNGWLAAIGATVVVPGLRLAWSSDAAPWARFRLPAGGDVVEAITTALPTERGLEELAISRRSEGHEEFPRKVSLTAFQDRAAIERTRLGGHLAASVSDLLTEKRYNPDDLDHGAFDPPVPQGITLWERAFACCAALPADIRLDRVRQTLAGPGHRIRGNGLGFDHRRLPTSVQGPGDVGDVHVDPVVELLAFSALVLFPTRGDGRAVHQRGWTASPLRHRGFIWWAWRPFLDRWAVDAFMDVADRGGPHVVARYGVVPYQPAGSSDVTRAYFAERMS